MAVEKIILFWEKARFLTQRNNCVAEKVIKLFTEWANLKKDKESKKKRSSQLNENENNFNKRLDNLFDVALKNALELIQIEEDRRFLLYQRDERQGRMGTIDKKLFQKQIKKNEKKLETTEICKKKIFQKAKRCNRLQQFLNVVMIFQPALKLANIIPQQNGI